MHSIKCLLVVCTLVLMTLLLVGCDNSGVVSHTVIVSGSTTILPIAEQAAELFSEANSGVSVLVSGQGSSAGIESVSTGTAQIGTASRELKDTEQDLGLLDTPIAYDGIAVIVNSSNPVSSLTSSQLAAIFAGKTKNWKELGGPDLPIDLINRDEASGTREAFNKMIMGDALFDNGAVILPGTGQVREVVSRAKGAIGYISVGFVAPRFVKSTVKALVVDGIVPSAENVANGTYPIARALHFFTKGTPNALTQKYIDFVLSDVVQDGAVVEAGFVPVKNAKGR